MTASIVQASTGTARLAQEIRNVRAALTVVSELRKRSFSWDATLEERALTARLATLIDAYSIVTGTELHPELTTLEG